jgi:hypothetical protein
VGLEWTRESKEYGHFKVLINPCLHLSTPWDQVNKLDIE